MRHREPIFNAPGVVIAMLGVFVAVHVVRILLPADQSASLTEALAFIPARLSRTAEFRGSEVTAVTQFFTHVLLHGDWTHLAINSAWFLAFGTPVARRVQPMRFLAFFFLCGIGGALFFYVLHPDMRNQMVGASGAISGLMGAAFRFLFRALNDGDTEALAGETRSAPLDSLAATLTNRRALMAIAGWTLLNIVVAWGAEFMDGMSVAWEAHLGGFYTGLITFGLFDPAQPPVHHKAADAD